MDCGRCSGLEMIPIDQTLEETARMRDGNRPVVAGVHEQNGNMGCNTLVLMSLNLNGSRGSERRRMW